MWQKDNGNSLEHHTSSVNVNLFENKKWKEELEYAITLIALRTRIRGMALYIHGKIKAIITIKEKHVDMK